MSRSLPKDSAWKEVVLDVEHTWCDECRERMHARKHEHHHIFTLNDPVHLTSKRVQCVTADCLNRGCLVAPDAILSWTMPRWLIGWDVFCWLGH